MCIRDSSTTTANKISRFQKSKMAVAAILKICKIAILPQRNVRFWWNLVQWCVWALWTQSANKIFWIQQYKMAAAAFLKKRKNLNIFPTDWQILTKFGMLMCVDPLRHNSHKILLFQKSKMAAAAILKIRKIAVSPQQTTNFDDIWHDDESGHRHCLPMKFHKFENPRWGRPPVWKIEKMLISS